MNLFKLWGIKKSTSAAANALNKINSASLLNHQGGVSEDEDSGLPESGDEDEEAAHMRIRRAH